MKANRTLAELPRPELEALLVAQLPLVERVTIWAGRRQGLAGDDLEELGGRVRLKLVEDDYRLLRSFQGQSTLETFLTTVILNLARDYRIERLGRWRPSAAARRLGEEAVQLERLLHCDGRTLDEAIATLSAHTPGQEHRLRGLADQLPRRLPRRREGPYTLETTPSPESADEALQQREDGAILETARTALLKALDGLTTEDRLLVQLYFGDGLTIAAIARGLELKQKPLYSRLHRILRKLRSALNVQGLDKDQVLAAVGWSDLDLGLLHEDDAASTSNMVQRPESAS